MSDFSVSDAAVSGLRLVRNKPMTVAAWGLFIFVAGGLPLALLAFVVGPHIVGIVEAVRQHNDDSPEVFREVFRMLAGVLLFVCALILTALFGQAILTGAIFRSVIEPKKSSFAYLRLGSQELWILLTRLVRHILLGLLSAVLSLPLIILIVSLGLDRHEDAGGLIWFGGHLVIWVFTCWLWLRLSMGEPLSFVERRFALFESWDLTKGYGWRLFFVALLVFIMTLVMAVVLCAIGGLALGAAGLTAGIDAYQIEDFFSRPAQAWIGAVSGVAVAMGFVISMVASIFQTVVYAPFATAYLELARNHKPEPGVAGLRLEGGPAV